MYYGGKYVNNLEAINCSRSPLYEALSLVGRVHTYTYMYSRMTFFFLVWVVGGNTTGIE